MTDNIPHAASRALERYRLKLTVMDLRAMAEACATGKSMKLANLPRDKERHALMVHGKAVVVVFAPYMGPSYLERPFHGRIITVLPREAASPGASSSPASSVRQRLRPLQKLPKKRRKKGF